MSNIVTFGCSLTYGTGLLDCYVPPGRAGPNPSSFAWPSKLASLGQKNCINRGQGGSGNFEIALSIISYEFQPQDICFILWSYPDRDIILHDDKSIERLGPWLHTEKFKKWSWLNPDRTKSIKFWYNVIAINNCLRIRNVPFYNLSVDLDYYEEFRPEWAKEIKFLKADIRHHRKNYPPALDGMHPGLQAHEAFARDIAYEIGWI